MPPTRRKTAAAPPGLSWDQVELAPVVLVRGTEGLLADRAVDRLLDQARQADPEVEVTRLEAAVYEHGHLEMVASPSLFGERRMVVVEGAESMTDALLDDVLVYLRAVPDDVWLVLRHNGGTRGKKLLDAIGAAGYPVVACESLKRDGDKADFVRADFRRARRRVDAEAVQALVEAVGADLRELGAATSQLIADTTGTITADTVLRYYGGRVEATGFKVADAAVAGHAGEAVAMLRHAVATGTGPVPIVAALAVKLRTLAKVAAVRGRSGVSAGELGLAPWQIDRARRELDGWTPEGLAQAITAVAAADAEVKGLGRDPVFAAERAVLKVAAAHGRRH
ncbi:DNA polymerase III subunit delta [Georgenia yuyongxinii]|uniref:DNA-directed DNA polymerase n=1 Tax=Georgenia yuyongxinii TaxID=2589797 RepID=A0A552WRL2_9MICO|nr:DNA polymerase III subunit delta [Georgenia yuyongxinii]TRW45441.1 DNA polymerase III subunit delta [Georgenia yuyongxinii]